MKLKRILGWSSALCLGAMVAQAQETNQPADFDQRLKQMQEKFERASGNWRPVSKKNRRAGRGNRSAQKTTGRYGNESARAGRRRDAVHQHGDTGAIERLECQGGPGGRGAKENIARRIQPGHRVGGRHRVLATTAKARIKPAATGPAGLMCGRVRVELNVAASVDPFAKGYAVVNASADSATGEANLASKRRPCRRLRCRGTWN